MRYEEDHATKVVKYFLWGLFSLVILILLLGSFFIVDAGQAAVVLTLGKPSVNAFYPGINFKIPIIQRAVKFDTRTLKYEADASAASKDLQVVTAKMAINYHILPASVPEIYAKLGPDYAISIIQPMEQEVVKASTAQFTAEELITKREDVRLEIKKVLTDRLAPRGIMVEEVSITNFDFSIEFNKAIEQKVTSQQLKLKADIDLERIKIEAEQTIASAHAQAESLRLQKLVVTPDLIKLRQIEVQKYSLDVQKAAIDKWDGKLSTTLVTGEGGMFSIFANANANPLPTERI